jgi:hypothetical protein
MNSNPHVDFIPLATTPNFSLSRKTTIRIQGAHGEEIVRSVYLDKSVGPDQLIPVNFAKLDFRHRQSSLPEKMDVLKLSEPRKNCGHHLRRRSQ